MNPKTWSDLTESEKTLVDVLRCCLPVAGKWKYSERKNMDAIITSYATNMRPFDICVEKDVAPQDASGIERTIHRLTIRKDDNASLVLIEHGDQGQQIEELYGIIQYAVAADTMLRNMRL